MALGIFFCFGLWLVGGMALLFGLSVQQAAALTLVHIVFSGICVLVTYNVVGRSSHEHGA